MQQSSKLDLGSITIHWLQGGYNQLDGGAMFGAVPKILWSKKCPPDAENYLSYRNDPLLIQTDRANIVIDTGLGNKLTEKQQKIYRVSQAWDVPTSLSLHGLRREDIDYVIFTHGDFDHAGGVALRNDSGELELTFPKARHIMQRSEWEDICEPNIRAAHTYFPLNFQTLAESGLLELVEGDADIVTGVRVRHSGGHTRGHQIVELTGSRGCAVHLGDLLPTHNHSNPLWVMSYDNFPLDVVAKRTEFFEEYKGKNSWFTFYHDFDLRACILDEKNGVLEELR
ncbi:MBL fold metallo-hydrolase [Desulfogranum japonicum]|uniref:MBL fold metallo-hydrolase n=1 Tax=Desulfogranum japonicum TaxID=231447 RepID=UPI0004166268|nr:MBL fold metallo-hydrolase [Desulfogranum japonicum]